MYKNTIDTETGSINSIDDIKDNYIFCSKCTTHVSDYCSLHGPLLIVPDEKIQIESSTVPYAVLTIPHMFLHLAPSFIQGVGLGVFSSRTIPCGVRFGPYVGKRTEDVTSTYCWQVHSSQNTSYTIDADDESASNWMRYINCSRNIHEQNLIAYQYRGQIYYRSIKIIPRFTELLVFYGKDFANQLNIDLNNYNEEHLSNRQEHTSEKQNLNIKYINNLQEEHCNKKLPHNNTIIDKINDSSKIEFSNIENKHRYDTPDTTKNVFTCEICNKVFYKKSYLNKHKIVHLVNKRFKCNYCDFKTNTNGNLQSHINCQHTKEYAYICEMCNRIFYRKRSLREHQKIHLK